MANFYKSGFLSIYVNKSSYMNQPVNIDKITRIRIYDSIQPVDKDADSDYRIYFEGDDQTCWKYDTIEKRNYEYEALLSNMNSVTRPSFNFQAYLADIMVEKKTKAESGDSKEKSSVQEEHVFIYRKDDSFFVTRDEHKVKAESTHYEKGILS